MSGFGKSTSTSIDLTEDWHESRQLIARDPRASDPSQPIHLATPHDHMHTVVDLLRPREADHSNIRKKRKLNANDSPSRRTLYESQPELQGGDDHHHRSSPLSPATNKSPQGPPQILSRHGLSSSSSSPTQQSKTAFSDLYNHRESTQKAFKAFPFMRFPPEIRNNVYRMLLTTGPIELPELTGRNGAAHRARWAKCTTAKQRKRHKTIFLEVLECSKQIHDEASGILYGCNVFKYRSMPGDGTKKVVLPTRHLQLLKHIKISVISGVPRPRQDQSVAALVRQFAKDGLKLETFEFTWFGQSQYHLRKDSHVCQALRTLDVQNSFYVKVGGYARMEKAMQEDLETSLHSRKVEIHRPVKAVTGEELSDMEGT